MYPLICGPKSGFLLTHMLSDPYCTSPSSLLSEVQRNQSWVSETMPRSVGRSVVRPSFLLSLLFFSSLRLSLMFSSSDFTDVHSLLIYTQLCISARFLDFRGENA